MRLSTLAASCAALLSATLAAQQLTPAAARQLVQARWPGTAILKATEAAFAEVAVTLADPADKPVLRRAFLDAQWSAHGLSADPTAETFLSPSGVTWAPSAIPLDSGVQEGPEPNGDPMAIGGGTPTVVGCGDQGEGRVFPYGDRDWWALTLPAAQRIVAFTGPGVGTSIDDTTLALYDQSGTLLTANDDYAPRGRFSQIVWDAPSAGTYYVAVGGFADVRTGTYALDLLCGTSAGGPPGLVSEVEPNGYAGGATMLPCGAAGAGAISPLADTDWWRFDLTSPARIIAETAAGQSGVPVGDSTLTLRDSIGLQLAYNDDANGLYSRIIANLPAGTYYLDVQAYNNSYTGSYELALTCQTSVAEPPEPNNSGATAALITCGDTALGTVSPAGDSDWWRIVLSGANTITLTTGAGSSGPINDTTLTLRDVGGNQLAFNDDSNGGLYSQISMQLAAGTYYADVQGYQSSVGSYTLSLDCASAVASAAFVAAPGGCAGSAGTPSLDVRPGELPILGSTFAFELSNLPANTVAVAFFGFSTTSTTSGGAPLPIDLGVIGAPGCMVEVDPLAFLPLTASSSGTATGYLPVPADPGLTSLSLFMQAVVVDSSANQLGLTLSNHGTAVLGDGL